MLRKGLGEAYVRVLNVEVGLVEQEAVGDEIGIVINYRAVVNPELLPFQLDQTRDSPVSFNGGVENLDRHHAVIHDFSEFKVGQHAENCALLGMVSDQL